VAGPQTLTLQDNYRSTPQVLASAEEMLAQGQKRSDSASLNPLRPAGAFVEVCGVPRWVCSGLSSFAVLPEQRLKCCSFCAQMIECRTDREEQTAVIELILEQQSAGVRLADMAVLFRTNEQGKVIERALVSM